MNNPRSQTLPLKKRELIISHMGVRCKVTSEDLIGCVVCPALGAVRLSMSWYLPDHKSVLAAIEHVERLKGSIDVLEFPQVESRK